MAKEELKIGEISKPRFEFRSFGRCFCEAAKRMEFLQAAQYRDEVLKLTKLREQYHI